jgi:aryl-alcohol dehydrogenase-like predicted oxidoreductase
MIDVAVENGINFIDTADMYGDGESEQIVGQGPVARLSGPSRGGPAVLSSRMRRRAREPFDVWMVGIPPEPLHASSRQR